MDELVEQVKGNDNHTLHDKQYNTKQIKIETNRNKVKRTDVMKLYKGLKDNGME